MAIVKFNKIEKLMSDIVASYLKDGSYRLTDSYNDSMVFHICEYQLISESKKQLVVVSLEEDSHTLESSELTRFDNVSFIELKVTEYSNFNCKASVLDNRRKGVKPVITEQKTFYIVKNAYKLSRNIYTDSLQEITKARETALARYNSNKDYNSDLDLQIREIPLEKLPDTFINAVMERVNNITGFRRAKANSITRVVIYRTNTARNRDLHLSANVIVKYRDKECRVDFN